MRIRNANTRTSASDDDRYVVPKLCTMPITTAPSTAPSGLREPPRISAAKPMISGPSPSDGSIG